MSSELAEPKLAEQSKGQPAAGALNANPVSASSPDKILPIILRGSMTGTIALLAGLLSTGLLPPQTSTVPALDTVLAAVAVGTIVGSTAIDRIVGDKAKTSSARLQIFILRCALAEGGGILGFLIGLLTFNHALAYMILALSGAAILFTPFPDAE